MYEWDEYIFSHNKILGVILCIFILESKSSILPSHKLEHVF